MKPISETHPSLKEEVRYNSIEYEYYSEIAIQKHTIDKQKVREAIDKLLIIVNDKDCYKHSKKLIEWIYNFLKEGVGNCEVRKDDET